MRDFRQGGNRGGFNGPRFNGPRDKRDFKPRPKVEIPEGWPEQGELLILKCTKILPYGAFFEIVEYPEDLEAFCHISEISRGWVKNIHSVVSKGQVYVGKVIKLDPTTNNISVSLGAVTESVKNLRLLQWRFDKRAKALMKVVSERLKIEEDEAWEKIAEPLIQEHESLYKGFESIRVNEAIDLDIPKKWKDELLDMIMKSIDIPKKTVKGRLTITSLEGSGVKTIQDVLNAAKKAIPKKNEPQVYTEGAPKYVVSLKAPDYKSAERELDKAVKAAEKEAGKHKGASIEFVRIEE